MEARDIQTAYLRFRHKLMPYLYSMNVRAATKGEPLCQPMYWQFPRRKEVYAVPNQYNFGAELLIVPITHPSDPETRLAHAKGWLPAGKYVDIFTGAVYEGNRELWLQRPLDLYPVFAKEGSIISLDDAAAPKNGCPNPEGIEVIIIVGKDGYFELVEDDDSGSVGSTIMNKTTIKYVQQTGTVEIIPGEKIKEAAVPAERTWTLRFPTCSLPDRNIGANEITLSVDGQDTIINPAPLQQPSQGFLLPIGSVPSSSSIRVNLIRTSSSQASRSPSLVTNDVAAYIYPILQHAQVKFGLKEAIWNAVTGGGSRIAQIARLHGIDMERKVMDAVMEHLTAQSGEWERVTKLDF